MPQAVFLNRVALIRLADSAVAAGHDIHMAMRALAMSMNPDKLFRMAAGGAARHHMRHLVLLLRLVTLSIVVPNCLTHLGPSLSFSRWRAATVPSWNVPNQASSGKSTLP